jgi:class 3 adenylate cyclase
MLSTAQATATPTVIGPLLGRWRPVLLALPLVGLAVLLARPELNIEWHHHLGHFWLVFATAAVSVVLAYVTNVAAGRHRDARVTLVSLAFLTSAGFLGLHAIATPGILVSTRNTGFMVATPVGLIIASGFALASVSRLAGPRADLIERHRGAVLMALVGLMVVWGAASLAGLGPLGAVSDGSDTPMLMDGPPGMAGMVMTPSMEETGGALSVLAMMAIAAYAIAAWHYLSIHRQRGGVLPLAVGAAFTLLAEATVAVVLSHNWEMTWWAWHLLMLVAFAVIAVGVRDEYRRSRSLTTVFGGLYSEATLARIDRWHADAIASVAAAGATGESTDAALDRLRRDGASEEEIALLTAAARELRRVDELFRPYLPSVVGQQLQRDPGVARLGGEEREVTVLFADLAGFTAFSDEHLPAEVIGMLNTYWAAVVPVIERSGGVVDYFAGDGVLAVFNAVGDQADHAERAVKAGLAIIEAARGIATAHPTWPMFRVGVNTGRGIVGNVGVEGRHSFTVIGDTTNVAARLLTAAEAGSVVASAATWAALADRAQRIVSGDAIDGVALGSIALKGKRDPVDAWRVTGAAAPA